MRRAGIIAVLLAGLLGGLLIFLPLRMGLVLAGYPASGAVYGTVWDGQIYSARLGGRSIAHVRLQVSPASLAGLKLAAEWRVTDPAINGQGRFEGKFSGDVRLSETRLIAAPAFLSGTLSSLFVPDDMVILVLDELQMRDGGCEMAAGEVRTDAVYNLGQRADLSLPSLAGPVACDGDAVTARLTGSAADGDVEVDLTWTGQARSWQVRIATTTQSLADVLANAGFVEANGLWTLDGTETAQ